MKTRNILSLLALGIGLMLLSSSAFGYTKVGSGDDGSDLEEKEPIKSGKIFEAREKAVGLLNKLNTSGIRGLGNLLPEVERAELFMVKSDTKANLSQDQGTFHSNLEGMVYARTIAEPYQPTRFFPIASSLSESQLVALHIHEGLHRSLPPQIREDENVVSQITLAITGSENSRDSVENLMNKYLPDSDLRSLPPAGPNVYAHVSEEEHFKQPSNVGYALRQYVNSKSEGTESSYQVKRMHLIHSDLYPFGGVNTPFGMGIEASMLETGTGAISGPLGLSARLRVWSQRDFDVSLWSTLSLNTLSAEELKNSPYGRDVLSLGVAMRKTLKRFYVENYLSLGTRGSAKQTIGNVEYRYFYGDVFNIKIKAGARLGHFDLGGFTEIHLSDDFRVESKGFNKIAGRYRILSAGPELTYQENDFSVSLLGRFLINSTKDADFSTLGNLMGLGVAQGSLGLSASVFF